MMEHTPTPWRLETGDHACFHQGNRVSIVAYDHKDPDKAAFEATVAEVWPTGETDRDIADGRRIVACVNACEGLSTDALEELLASGLTLAHAIVIKPEQLQ